MARTLELNELPRYSPWVRAFLEGESITRTKTKEAILREFDHDKWGHLLDSYRSDRIGLDQLRIMQLGAQTELASVAHGHLELLAPEEALRRQDDLVAAAVGSADRIVELGCGYGSTLVALARGLPRGVEVSGFDISPKGVELATLVADDEGVAANFAVSDMHDLAPSTRAAMRDATVFTAYALHYSVDPRRVLEAILESRPSLVVHVEPIYEHAAPDLLIGQLQRGYIRSNGYTTNIASTLHQMEEQGQLRVVREDRSAFGANCLLPASVVAWQPV